MAGQRFSSPASADSRPRVWGSPWHFSGRSKSNRSGLTRYVCSVANVDRAVKAARAAFDSGPWRQTSAADRGRLLYKLAEKIRANAAALAELECRNSGKPIVEAEYDIADAATCFEYYAGLANKVLGHVNPVPANALSFTLREPVGVSGQIIPWNYPLVIASCKLAPAIAPSPTCVVKPP